MKITRHKQGTNAERSADWHILTVAEAGFSMLDIYGRQQHGLDIETIRQFADRVNERDEVGSLHPRVPISAVPCRFFREQENSTDPLVLLGFKHHIVEFLGANRDTIRAQRILVDFHVSTAPVPRRYIDATEEVFRQYNQDDLIQEVVVLT
jgi:hypothetical protein